MMLFNSLVIVYIMIINNNNNANCLKCFVCNSCPDSILSILIKSYNVIQDCPLGYNTCVKESYGNAYVTRSCSNETCEIRSAFLGNGRFCCHTDLCNKSTITNTFNIYNIIFFILFYSYILYK